MQNTLVFAFWQRIYKIKKSTRNYYNYYIIILREIFIEIEAKIRTSYRSGIYRA